MCGGRFSDASDVTGIFSSFGWNRDMFHLLMFKLG
jgi:hypothetical protein